MDDDHLICLMKLENEEDESDRGKKLDYGWTPVVVFILILVLYYLWFDKRKSCEIGRDDTCRTLEF